jgi:transcription termination/antitermination protein NusA
MLQVSQKELLALIYAVSKEKNVDEQSVREAISDGIEIAIKKDFPEGSILRAWVDEQGVISAWRVFKLVNQIENVESEMLFNEVEDEIVEDGLAYESINLNLTRQQLMTTKQMAMQKLAANARLAHFEELYQQDNLLLLGNIKTIKKDKIILEHKGLDIEIPKSHLSFKQAIRINNKIFFTLVKEGDRYFGSQTVDQFAIEMLHNEIPAIKNGEVKIVGIARIPGLRMKVLVKNSNSKYDPSSICIGAKGARVKSLVEALDGEQVDFLTYSENNVDVILKSLGLNEIHKIVLDEDSKEIHICVSEDEACRINKGSLNITLLNQLLDMHINVISLTEWENQEQLEYNKKISLFTIGLNCDEDLALELINEGYNTLKDVAYSHNEDHVIDDELFQELKLNAKHTIADVNELQKALGAFSLHQLGFNEHDIRLLNNENVFDKHGVSELSTYDLIDILPTIGEEKAKTVILNSRK